MKYMLWHVVTAGMAGFLAGGCLGSWLYRQELE